IDLTPISGPSAWRGEDLAGSTEWIYQLSDAERDELEAVGRRFVADDPDMRAVTADDYPLDACTGLIEECARQMDPGPGCSLVRRLRTPASGCAVAAAVSVVMGLHLGSPMPQNQYGDGLDQLIATSETTMDDPTALPSPVRHRLPFHSDSSD